jgi:hypothetical protein
VLVRTSAVAAVVELNPQLLGPVAVLAEVVSVL